MMRVKGWMTIAALLLGIGPLLAQEEGEAAPDTTVVVEDTLQLDNGATIGPNQPGVNRPDTVVIKSMAAGHSPRKAALFSAVLPGLGQAYNGKPWKIPIIYGGFATLGYLIIYNDDLYNLFLRAETALANGEESPLDGYAGSSRYTSNNLSIAVDGARRDRDFMVILTAGLYALNIMDAIVDAHLIEFDINPELSFDLKPMAGSSLAYTDHLTPTLPTYGFSFTINLP
uniref:DUF5683 domain-containing protein n=1 Tax=Roseihalotalea indica TaxID=2867963 RepID=A0AA49GJ80_9BACT|nr:DUF5683 domain-containing protein [Tunicatimonas sp. TK19036]